MRSAPTRRGLIGERAVMAALALVAPGPAVAAAADPHPVWERGWKALLDRCDGPAPGGRELREFWQWHRLEELEGLVCDTPARTLAGAIVQVRLAAHWCGAAIDEEYERGLESALATLDRLAAGEVRA